MATDVFVSYAREDRELAEALADAFAADGHAVWWDRDLGGGDDFSLEIERQLNATRVAVVLWSAASAQSSFVRDESSRARDAGKLLPLRIEDIALPLGFGSLHTLDLIGWDGDADDPACIAVRDAVRGKIASRPMPLLDAPPIAAPPRPRPSLRRKSWRWAAAAALGGAALTAALWLHDGGSGEREAQAQQHLNAGLAAHFAREPNLEVARNAYLAALRAQPDLASAHYYLAHVYALLKLPADARTHFESALAHADGLDPAQRSDAEKQRAALQALLGAGEPAPLASTASPAPAAAPVVVAAPRPSPAPAATAQVRAEAARLGAAVGTALIRTPPSDAVQRAAQEQSVALLGSDRQARVSAATALALDAGLASDTLPLVLQQTLDALAKAPGSDDARQAVAATLRLLQSASPSLLRTQARDAQRIVAAGQQFGGTSAIAAADVQQRLAKVDDLKPFVFIQIADERQRPLAQSVAARLAAMGYSAPGIENVGAARAPARTEVRVQGASDPALARWMAQHLAKLVEAQVPVQTLRQAQSKTDTYEIWLGKPLCVQSDRVVAACRGS
jgi:TIR domain